VYVIDTVPLRTVNRQCSSGLQAVADVAAAIRCGYYDIGEFLNSDIVNLCTYPSQITI
jgi:Thiolase, N-terminal domain